MNILAVIPARAGSKGIPNKNIRILNEKPLVFYAINNALRSKYITDIVVTTDSEIVQGISRQLGVSSRKRNANLCEDDTTLDSVVFDAIPKGSHYDYIITLQPTSPTLKTNTLDQAIECTIKNNYDTIISVINDPHLSWSKDGKKIVPNYKERLNRQYLPSYFIETGAFLISKAEVVTEHNRIGKEVGVYEISKDEAIDIDNFQDLQLAEQILCKQKVAIYTNGNNEIGSGHIYRALEIADEFFVKPDIYYDVNQTERSIFGETTHSLIPVKGIEELFEKCEEDKCDIFINDILDTSVDYMTRLRDLLPDAKIVNFEDDGEGAKEADLVFNALYGEGDSKNIYSGEKYYISSKSFMLYDPITIRDKVKRIFISFGGADPQNYTERLLKIISKEQYNQYSFIVVLGRAKDNIDELMKFGLAKNIDVYYDVKNMPHLMSQCDVAVTSRGRTGYELAMLGIPTLAMAQNEREERHNFVCEENGFNYIGINPTDEIIEANLKILSEMSAESRRQYQKLMLRHDLRNGRKRIVSLINNL